MNKQSPKPNEQQLKVERERTDLNRRMDGLKSEAGIHRERLARRTELMNSCDRELREARSRLQAAEKRHEEMLQCMDRAPGEIDRLEGEMDKIRQRLSQMDHAAQIAKATDLANQILALQKMGYTITPPGGAV